MQEQQEKVNILIVDDKPDKILAIEAVLEELGENIHRANSGREALRFLLQKECAVILLDINMPGMDGFETATLIRQRRSSHDTPIIFLTAFGDDFYASRSYALGAVDYILTPVVPEVLKTKVSVFVDLYRKASQIRKQAETLRKRTGQLHKLSLASLAINSAESIDAVMRAVTDSARDLLDVHQATTTLAVKESPTEDAKHVLSLSDRYASFYSRWPLPTSSALWEAPFRDGPIVRLRTKQFQDNNEWTRELRAAQLPLNDYLAVKFTSADSERIGQIQVSGKREGDFSDEDEYVLMQLAQFASIAIENCLFAQAREANRLKDEFLSILSHELRTPLSVILGWTRILRGSNGEDRNQISRGLEVIERNAQTQLQLIEELLDISRINAGKLALDPKRLVLGELLDNAIESFRPAAAAKNVTLASSIAEDVQVDVDPIRIQQVISNLLTNALKFTPSGGSITVNLRATHNSAEISVVDTGEGIPQEFLPLVFERFRQADSSSKRSQGGLGIGLAIVRQIVELHSGSVEAHSEGKGQGSTFTVRLPLFVARDESQVPSQLSRNRNANIRGAYVMVVEDDPDARDIMRQVLELHEAQVVAVGSVREALDAFAIRVPDVLVSDIAMPGEDGYELIRKVRRRPGSNGGSIPALALTAYARKEDQVRALAAGFQMHAPKPIAPLDLVTAVSMLIMQSQTKAKGGEVTAASSQ